MGIGDVRMRIVVLLILFFSNFMLQASAFRPLDFDQVASKNVVADVLKTTTILFDLVENTDCSNQGGLELVSTKLMDLVGDIYILKRESEQVVLLEDVEYLADLIFDLEVSFKDRSESLDSNEIYFIKSLLTKLQNILPTMQNQHQCCH